MPGDSLIEAALAATPQQFSDERAKRGLHHLLRQMQVGETIIWDQKP